MAVLLNEEILKAIDDNGQIDTYEYAISTGRDHQIVVGAVKSIQSMGNLVTCEQRSFNTWSLTDEGKEVLEHGSHEAVVYASVDPTAGTLLVDIMERGDNAKLGFSKAMSNGWVMLDKNAEGGARVFRKVDSIIDEVKEKLRNVAKGSGRISEDELKEYKRRKLITNIITKSYIVSKGDNFSTSVEKLDTDLTPDMIANDSWKDCTFKEYNFDAMGIPPVCGHLHPLMKVRAQYRQIFLEMGFIEMPTNNFIESSFWNFDALFQPQQHPARDAHDTFFLKDPEKSFEFPQQYLEKVKTVHQYGGFGSEGYKYEWKLEEAQKNILRTHTTAVSARMLYKLGQQKFTPAKYFSIDRVFRNETLDATHLAEFHQIEGVVADYDLTLGHLIGILYAFFKKLGMEKLRFKPAYNPYTEPSMEVFSYHEGLKKWVEVGNSGVFRPEMLLPMGLPENVSVIAWGLSVERPTMIMYGVDNIRELVGHKINLERVYTNPICRLDN
ncbi:phenylalanine--tRNA ligase alpha subunit-like [Dysidea avara]|uniref:phenylalanine--tRNA ligase alpha subunit-like n=1 Tax=Dysidea avara TaxID=196820 RepID=UPI003320CF86